MGASTDSLLAQTGISSMFEVTKSAPSQPGSRPVLDIIDIRSAAVEVNLKDEIRTLFTPKDGPRKLPTLLLYNERGLQLFEDVNPAPPVTFSPSTAMPLASLVLTAHQITYLDEYYLTNDEIKVLKNSASSIAQRIPAGAMVIELGSG